VIIPMTRVRIAGPRGRLDQALGVLQDVGVVHLVKPAIETTGAPPHDTETRHLRRILDDVEVALRVLGVTPDGSSAPETPDLPRSALRAGRVRRWAERLARALAALSDERTLLLRYAEFFKAFEALLGEELGWPDGHAFYIVLRAGARDAVERLRSSLDAAVGGEMELLARPLASGETAVLLLASSEAAPKVGQLLSASRVQELPAPTGLGETNVLRALPALKARLGVIPGEIDALEAERAKLRDEHQVALLELRVWLHDRLLLLDARRQAHAGRHLFVIEGWVPEMELEALIARASRELGDEVVVEAVGTEPWSRADAPVALRNPPLFRPFELITRTLPLPKYGTIDPTPFVAVFFPMFFGLMLGDVGYGGLLAVLALVLGLRSKPGSALRSVSLVGGACAVFAIIFGFVFGELFGPTGRDFIGMHPLGFDREEAIIPFLGLAVALGVVHVSLGLVLAVVNSWRLGERRQAMGRGVAAIMVALTVSAILAALKVLPTGLFTPFAIAVLVAFPLLIALEGIVAVVELLSAFGHILSYARIMALGTASLMLAVVANKMVGAMGSVLVGVLFALLFHVVNFAIGLFSPTIHALRLHYVEFFGKFFSPGGTAYRPFGHWHPSGRG
jgi:V/A-type H+-transporting ATPase subunit I